MKSEFYCVASIDKISEGGHMRHKDVVQAGKDLGIEAKGGHSIYVGQFGVYVKTEDKRKIAKLLRRCGL